MNYDWFSMITKAIKYCRVFIIVNLNELNAITI